MKNMSFFHTKKQILDESKTVTRRLGWKRLKAGDLVQSVEKCQGLKKGQKMQKLKVLKVVHVRREKLFQITHKDVIREGFPEMKREEFIQFFMKMNNCPRDEEVTRIEFEYL